MPRLVSLKGVDRAELRRTVFFCVRCKKRKAKELFYRNKLTPTGVTSYCKACYKEYHQQRKLDKTE